MKIITFLIFIIFSLALYSEGMDFTDDAMAFDSEEIEQTLEEQPEARRLLDKGKDKYKAKKYKTAANYFFKVIDNPKYKASYNEAYFNLGKSMRKLKLFHLSLFYFDKAIADGELSPFFNATLKYLSNLSKYVKNSLILTDISKYDPKKVPQKYKESLYYLAGKFNYQKGNFTKSVQYLKLLPKKSPDYLKSRYLLAVLYARLGKTDNARVMFKEIIDYKGKVYNEKEYLKLVELSIIGMARVYYQEKDYDRSILYFNKVTRFSEHWLDSIFESSWAFLMKGDYAKSLGNLVTLRSPSFYKEFYPEKYIIEALIYYNNCDYKMTNKIIDKFLKDYRPLRKGLTKLIKSTKNPYKFYQLIKKSRKKIIDPRMEWILNISLKDKGIKKGFSEIKAVDKEIAKIKRSKKKFLKTKLAKAMLANLNKERADIEKKIGNIALTRFKRVVNNIRTLLTQARVIRQAILEIKEAKITKELITLKINKEEYFELDKEKIILSTPEDRIYWPFQGEYWKDELGYYLYPILSQCKKKE